MENTELLNKLDQIILLLKNGQFAYQKPTIKPQKNKMIKKGGQDMQRGSITFRSDGRWMGRCYDENKKQKCVYGRTKKECAEKLKEAIEETERRKRSPQVNTSMTLMEYFEFWFKTYKELTLKESSAIQTKRIMYRHLESIGNYKIKNINSQLLQLTINSIDSDKEKAIVYSNLKAMYEKMFFMGVLAQNIMGMVIIPKEQKNKIKNISEISEEKQILELGEENTFVYKKIEIKYKYFIEFAINTGMRPAEILGLQKQDIDFEKKCIYINKQLNNTTGKISTPKSNKGNRIIPLFDKTESVLREMNIQALNDDDFIFKIKYTGIRQFLQKLSQIHGATITCYTFRKTFASRCQHVYSIDPKQVQNWLGHENLKTTDKHYTHISEAEKNQNIQKYNEFVSDTHIDTH